MLLDTGLHMCSSRMCRRFYDRRWNTCFFDSITPGLGPSLRNEIDLLKPGADGVRVAYAAR